MFYSGNVLKAIKSMYLYTSGGEPVRVAEGSVAIVLDVDHELHGTFKALLYINDTIVEYRHNDDYGLNYINDFENV